MYFAEILLILLAGLAVQFFLVATSIGVGRLIIDHTINMDSEPEHLRVGACFFVGVAFLVVFVRALTFMSNNAKFSVVFVIIITTICTFLKFRNIIKDIFIIFHKSNLITIFFVFTVISILLLLYWTPPEINERNPFSNVGSLHSYRYAWVTNLIYQTNNIPVISQNTAQSILAFIGSVFSFPAPFLYLFLWLISSILFLSIFLYGIIYKLSGDKRRSIYGLVIFMLGNTALSTTHVLTIDSGSPFLLSGYSDTLFGIFSVFFIIFLNDNLCGRKNLSPYLFFVSCLIVSFNFYCAPQNVLFIPLLILCFYLTYPKDTNLRFKFLSFWLLVFLISSLISVPQGGMLTPSSLLSDVSYSGIMSPSGTNGQGLAIQPGIPFHFGWLGSWQNGWMPNLAFSEEYIKNGQGRLQFVNQIFWNLEQIFITSIRVQFFPIVGIFFMCFCLHKIRGHGVANKESFQIKRTGFYGSVLLIFGFIFCFSFSLNGYKWELSRFLIPGISIGMIGISLATVHVLSKPACIQKPFVFLISLFVVFGPAVNFISTSSINAYYLIDNNILFSYFFDLIGPGPILS
jgi:hypothetical protein